MEVSNRAILANKRKNGHVMPKRDEQIQMLLHETTFKNTEACFEYLISALDLLKVTLKLFI